MRRMLVATLCCIAVSTPALASVTVEFVAPGGYSDANLQSRYGGGASPSVLHGLEAHMTRRAQQYLAPAESLTIQVTDIDLAGEIEPFRRGLYDTRVLRSATWPRITLKYTLTRNGEVLREAREVISDPGYMLGTAPVGHTGNLYYEKRMLDDWFRRRFTR